MNTRTKAILIAIVLILGLPLANIGDWLFKEEETFAAPQGEVVPREEPEQPSRRDGGPAEFGPMERLKVDELCTAALEKHLASRGYTSVIVLMEYDSFQEQSYTSNGYSGNAQAMTILDGEIEFEAPLFCEANLETRTASAALSSGGTDQHSEQGRGIDHGDDPEPDIDFSKIDPRNDASGSKGRDDNAGIYYHNSVDWEFLKAPGEVVPGGAIINTSKGSGCSAGFIVSGDNRTFVLTAGHCGERGDRFAIQDKLGNSAEFGHMVESLVDGKGDHVEGVDIGLIEITETRYVDSSLPTEYPLKGWISSQDAHDRDLTICHLGKTTGYSCGVSEGLDKDGQFFARGIYDRGDSGGPVFALDQDGAWAVGVISRVSDYNKTKGGSMEIASAMEQWGLQMHG